MHKSGEVAVEGGVYHFSTKKERQWRTGKMT